MSDVLPANAFTVRFRFHALSFFLSRENKGKTVTKTLAEKTSVKDAVESCGVPHPEIDLVCCEGVAVPLAYSLTREATIDIYGLSDSPAKLGEGLQQRRVTKFVADGHLGKLARDLRLLGLDVLYGQAASDSSLAASCSEDRALLTRDRRLLMHKIVRHGYCPRSHDPDEQIIEVIGRFELTELIEPYTRCLQCNGLLTKVAKEDVLDQLEPLTKIHYDDFRCCSECGKIYWAGSHFGKLEARLEKIRLAVTRFRIHEPDQGPFC